MKQLKPTDVENKVKAIIADKFNLKVDEIKKEFRLVEDLGADSLSSVEVIMEIEAEFGISIPDEEAMHLSSVKDMVEYLTKNKHPKD